MKLALWHRVNTEQLVLARMFSVFRLSQPFRLIREVRCFANVNESADVVEYPKIIDQSLKGRRRRKFSDVHEDIQNVKTVEEKQIKLNMPRYYGWPVAVLNNERFPYNCLPFIQHITRTFLITEPNILPSFYDKFTIDDDLVKSLRNDIEEVFYVEYHGFKRSIDGNENTLSAKEKDELLGDSIAKNINRIMINRLQCTCEYLQDIEIDFNPRHEAFWNVGGINPPKNVKKRLGSIPHLKEFANEPIDRIMQFTGSPFLTLRHQYPLEPIWSSNHVQNKDFMVPFVRFDPTAVGFSHTYRHGTNIPGFWPGDESEFGLLSYQKRGFLVDRTFGHEDNSEALQAHGILSSFAWLFSLANYQGFTTFNDITYPIVSQTICTNGQYWSFFVYQLNTLLFCLENIYENPKKNICYSSNDLKLFESIDENGRVIGLNDDVIKALCKMYMNVPKQRDSLNLKPFLGDEKYVADYIDDDKRNWLEREYKTLMSNRPRKKLPDEMHHWEKIYKVDHKMRNMEPLLRFFEVGKHIYTRKYDDRPPEYWPKKLRPHGNKKPKFYKTYFP